MLAIAGALACVIATRAPWASGPPQIITVPGTGGFQSVNLRAGEGSTEPGSALRAGGAAAASLGVIACIVLGLVARSRRVLVGMGTIFSIVALVLVVLAAPGVRERAKRTGIASPAVRRGAIAVSIAGAAVGLAGSMVAMASSTAAPAARLPESAPEEDPETFDD